MSSKSELFIIPREPAERPQLPNNLPIELDQLVGREKEVEAVRRLLTSVSRQRLTPPPRPDQSMSGANDPEQSTANDAESPVRMVTLVGPGGVGKTRLALEVAEELARERQEQFDGGVFFVELGPIVEAALLF